MGLDNMPHAYPCKEQGTAVIEKKTHTWEDENGNMVHQKIWDAVKGKRVWAQELTFNWHNSKGPDEAPAWTRTLVRR